MESDTFAFLHVLLSLIEQTWQVDDHSVTWGKNMAEFTDTQPSVKHCYRELHSHNTSVGIIDESFHLPSQTSKNIEKVRLKNTHKMSHEAICCS